MPELKKEQQDVIMHERGNILVSASAGSGKTFVMIERLIRLITDRKATVNGVLCVTFTEAAAADMKQKLKKALSERADGDEYLSEQLLSADGADICTLHAFCSRLIRTYFFAAGISPDFSIADAAKSETLLSESIDEAVREGYKNKTKEFLALCDAFSARRTDAELKETLKSIYRFAESEIYPEEFYRKCLENYSEEGFNHILSEYESGYAEELTRVINVLSEQLKIFAAEGLKKSEEYVKSLISDATAALSGGVYATKGLEEYNSVLSFERGLKGNALTAKEKTAACRDELKSILKRYARHVSDKNEDLNRFYSAKETSFAMIELLKSVGKKYAAAKRDENLLDFSDLEHFALKALSDESVFNAVRTKYSYVFVDEYQDINGVQEAILSAVSRDNLFMVGDVKQSIYGFRGCRPEIFTAKKAKMERDNEKTVSLNYNFRSSEAVINFANRVFSFSMTKDFYGESYADTAALVSGGIYGENAVGRAKLHLYEKPKRKRAEKETPRVYDILREINAAPEESEPDAFALIAKIINDELKESYYDVKTDAYKPVTFGDVAILTRNKNNAYVQKLVAGLKKRGVPVTSEVSENVLDFSETILLKDLLEIIDNFKQDVPLSVVMKSPVGGFTEEELAEIVLHYTDGGGKQGFAEAYSRFLESGAGATAEKLKGFDEYIKKLRFQADFVGAKTLLERAISDCGLESFYLASQGGGDKLVRVKRFVSLAEQGGRDLSVREFLTNVRRGGKAFEIISGGTENAVKVMTIHASKGLEFPVTIVCGLEKKMNSEEDYAEVLLDRDYGFAVKRYDYENRVSKETVLRGVIKNGFAKKRVKEELRLFYVALTRARYSTHLVFAADKDGRKDEFVGANRFLDYVPSDIPLEVSSESDFTSTEVRRGVRKVLIGKTDEKTEQTLRENFTYVYPYAVDCTLPLKSTVTDVLNRETPVRTEYYDEAEKGGTDAKKGVTAHKILQYLDYDKSESVEEAIKRLISAGVLTDEEVKDVDATRLEKAAALPSLKNLSGKKLSREKSFIALLPAKLVFGADSDEDVLVQGVIDLLAESEAGAEIIDYKYSVKSKNALKETYAKQLNLYAAAVEKITGKKVISKTLVNVYAGEEVKID